MTLHPIPSSRSKPSQHAPQLVTFIPSAATCQGPGCRKDFGALDVEESGDC